MLSPFLNDHICPLQSSFILGRATKDNVILATGIIHYMHHSKVKNGIIAYKIDLEKTYDKVSWDLLELTLRDFDVVPENIISLIMGCMKAAMQSDHIVEW